MTVSHDSFVENNERFTFSFYNGISILTRDVDGFVNAGKMCTDAKEKFYNFTRGKRWQEIIDYYVQLEGSVNLRYLYNLRKGYDKAQGNYLNPDLVHFVAEWISIPYAFKVKRIMDSINERSQVTGETFEDISEEIIKKQKSVISKLKQRVEEQSEVIEEQSKTIEEQSVRSQINNYERLFIFRDESGAIKLSVNQRKPPKNIIETFIFPSAMTIKQDIKREFQLSRTYIIEEQQLEHIVEFINERLPK